MISAFRYTLSDSRDTFNNVLRPLIVPLLVNMLGERDLGNHRLALTTLNSAIHNKLALILPHLGELLPAVIGDTQIKPELIREVQMGPFKHKVDDGLELRKVSIQLTTPVSSPRFTYYNVSLTTLPSSDCIRDYLCSPRHFIFSLSPFRNLRPHPCRNR